MIYYSLAPHIYAADLGDTTIILDTLQDRYLSFIDDTSEFLKIILNESFDHSSNLMLIPVNNKELNVEDLNYWISYFVKNNFIVESNLETRKSIANGPIKPDGLCEYHWDYKESWQPFKQASKLMVLKALIELARVHRTLKRHGIQGILDAIKSRVTRNKMVNQPDEKEIEKLIAAVDAASILYPKKTFCLSWAATFTLMALKNCWPCKLVIGVQANPFYAHAWAQIENKVIHDDPVIAEVLSIILKEPM